MGQLRLKYLEMIQAVVTRLAGNQFTLRTWSVALGSAVIGYAASKEAHVHAAYLGVMSAVTFWILDAYYLALERGFRDLYNGERVKADDAPSMDLSVKPSIGAYFKAWLRPAVWLVHLPVLVLALVVGGGGWSR
jgi:hypothetical protein